MMVDCAQIGGLQKAPLASPFPMLRSFDVTGDLAMIRVYIYIYMIMIT